MELDAVKVMDYGYSHLQVHHATTALQMVASVPEIMDTLIYSCITLLQLLYRWQHQSRKLWIL
jgi:hypothetical protein